MHPKGNAKIELFPLYLQPESFKFRAIAHASERSVLVTADEALALRILAKEKSTKRTLERLRSKHQRLEVNVGGLIERLRDAGLVHRLDGEVVERPFAQRLSVMTSFMKLGLRRAFPLCLETVGGILAKWLPIPVLVAAGRIKYQWLYPRKQRRSVIDAVAAKMSAVLESTRPSQRKHLATRHFEIAEVEKNLDLLVLMRIPHRKIGPWALSRVENLDLSSLEEVLSQGRGALVFHFHMGPIQMMSVILTALGFRVTVLGANIARAREADMLMRIVDDLGPNGVRQLMQALERGEIVMISPDPDVHPVGARKDGQGFRERFANSWKHSSQVKTQLLGYEVSAFQGIAWLHSELATPLLYAEIRSLPKGKLAFSMQPFAVPARNEARMRAWRQQIMDAIFAHYDLRLKAHPEQWDHWLAFFRYVNLKPKLEEPWYVLGTKGNDLAVEPGTKVQVGPYVLQPFKDDKTLVIRMGTQSVMLTNPFGLAALDHLRKGVVLEELVSRLRQEGFQLSDTSQLFPFLRALKAAGLLSRIDDQLVARPPVEKLRWCLHFGKIKLYPALFRLVDRRLGLGMRQRVLPRMEWWMEGRFKYLAQRHHLQNNLALLLPILSPHKLEKSAKAWFKEEIHADLACQFTRRKVATVFRWLDLFLEKEMPGLEALRAQVRRGSGAIVASYHYGLFWLLPALLWKLGFRVHALVGSVLQSEDDLSADQPAEFSGAGVHFYDTHIRNIAAFPKLLERGDVVLIYADAVGRFAEQVNRTVHRTWGKSSRDQQDVTLLGHTFPLQPGVGWLHAQTGAPVFPAVLARNAKSGKARLTLEAPLHAMDAPPNRLGISALTSTQVHSALFEILGRWIEKSPEQWRNSISFPHIPMKRIMD